MKEKNGNRCACISVVDLELKISVLLLIVFDALELNQSTLQSTSRTHLILDIEHFKFKNEDCSWGDEATSVLVSRAVQMIYI
jgi:hypothetical protein